MSSLETILTWLWRELGVWGFLDILIMTVTLYLVLAWIRRTKRAAQVLLGVIIISFVYLITQHFNLYMTSAVLQWFFAVFVIAIVVIFQEELRYFFEQVAHWSMDRKNMFRKKTSFGPENEGIRVLSRTIADLAKDKIGAIVVLPGHDALVRHIEGGQTLDGKISEALLKSIFDPHSIGHDGAVILDHNRIAMFGCHLPLSRQLEKLKRGGTRHAAALGLSEKTDALCIVVSEERGVISLFRHGQPQEIESAGMLEKCLHEFYREFAPTQENRYWKTLLLKNYREKSVALVLASALWFVLVHEAKLTYRTFKVPVTVAELSDPHRTALPEFETISITISGPRRAFYFVRPEQVRVELRPGVMTTASRTITVSSTHLHLPDGLMFEASEPAEIQVRLKPKITPPR